MKDCESESHSVTSDSLRPHGLYSPWNSLGQNTGVGSLSLLQGIFPTQGPNPGILHHKRIPYQLSHQGSPWRTVDEVILQRSVAWSNLHFNKTTPNCWWKNHLGRRATAHGWAGVEAQGCWPSRQVRGEIRPQSAPEGLAQGCLSSYGQCTFVHQGAL